MKKTRHTTAQVIEKLRQADVALGKGEKVPNICRTLGITEQTYYRWRQKYGGMAPEMARELKALQKENSRLKKHFWRWARYGPHKSLQMPSRGV